MVNDLKLTWLHEILCLFASEIESKFRKWSRRQNKMADGGSMCVLGAVCSFMSCFYTCSNKSACHGRLPAGDKKYDIKAFRTATASL